MGGRVIGRLGYINPALRDTGCLGVCSVARAQALTGLSTCAEAKRNAAKAIQKEKLENDQKSFKANISVNLRNLRSSRLCRSSILIENRDHSICWMRDDSTENTSNVARHKGNSKLGTLTVTGFLFGEDISVKTLDNFLKVYFWKKFIQL